MMKRVYTYTILDVERNEIIGFVEAIGQREAMMIARVEYNSGRWVDRFPFSVEVGRELAIRPDYDQDPYFQDCNAKLIEEVKTIRR